MRASRSRNGSAINRARNATSDAGLARLTSRDRATASASSPSLSERAYQTLRQAIHEGTIEPNTHLTEVDLAEWLQMSRTPVREAMRRLESEGVLLNQPFRGAVVVALDESDLRELYAVRELLEVAAASGCAASASDTEIAAMRELVEREKQCLRDPRALSEINRQLHQQICKGAHNRFLAKALENLHGSFALLGKSNLLKEDRAKASTSEHRAILNAIERRDRKAAEAAARAHVRTSLEQRLKSAGKASCARAAPEKLHAALRLR